MSTCSSPLLHEFTIRKIFCSKYSDFGRMLLCIWIKGSMKAGSQNSGFCFFSEYQKAEIQGRKELLFSPFNLWWKSGEWRKTRENGTGALYDQLSSEGHQPLGSHLCIGKAAEALCPVDARQKNISLLLSNTGPDLSAESHVKSQNLNPDLLLSFAKVCRNQDLAVCDFKNISTWHVNLADLNWSFPQCWWLLSYIGLWLTHQIHSKSTSAPHIKLRALRQMSHKMNVWIGLISITYLFNIVQRIPVGNVQQDELTLLTCTFMQYLL